MKKYFYILLGLLGAYEGVALLNKTPGDSISEIVWSASDKGYGAVIILAVGLVCGHLFWYRR